MAHHTKWPDGRVARGALYGGRRGECRPGLRSVARHHHHSSRKGVSHARAQAIEKCRGGQDGDCDARSFARVPIPCGLSLSFFGGDPQGTTISLIEDNMKSQLTFACIYAL